MKKIGLIGVLAVAALLACDNEKVVQVFNQSQFFAVRVDPQAVTLAQGSTQQLTVTAFDATCIGANCNPLAPGNAITVPGTATFRSTDTTVATVSETGLVTAKAKAGTANIIGALQDLPGGQSVPSTTRADTTPVTVLAAGATPPAVAEMTLTSSRSTNGVGSTDTLTITYTDASGATVATQRAASNPSGIGRPAFFSSDPTVATVGATGIVTGIKQGTATITAVNTVGGSTKTATFPITITDPVSGFFAITPATTGGSGIIFTPSTLTVSATEAVVEGRPNTTTRGAVVTWGVFGNGVITTPFTDTTTPNNIDCFNVTFTDPSAAGAAPTAPSGSTVPAGNTGNIGAPPTATNPPLCSVPTGTNAFGKDAQSRLFTTPGTYTFTSTTNGATATLIVK